MIYLFIIIYYTTVTTDTIANSATSDTRTATNSTATTDTTVTTLLQLLQIPPLTSYYRYDSTSVLLRYLLTFNFTVFSPAPNCLSKEGRCKGY